MTADLTKCFFQIGLPEEQCNLLWIWLFENDDVGKRKIVSFRFTRHYWGVKSSPFIASWQFKKRWMAMLHQSVRLDPGHYEKQYLHR